MGYTRRMEVIPQERWTGNLQNGRKQLQSYSQQRISIQNIKRTPNSRKTKQPLTPAVGIERAPFPWRQLFMPNYKGAKVLNRRFSKEETQMANKHTK